MRALSGTAPTPDNDHYVRREGRGDLARHPLCRAAEQAKFGWAEPQPPVTATCPFAPDQALNRRIMLRGLPAGDVRVRIVARTRRGYTVSQTRRYRLCR